MQYQLVHGQSTSIPRTLAHAICMLDGVHGGHSDSSPNLLKHGMHARMRARPAAPAPCTRAWPGVFVHIARNPGERTSPAFVAHVHPSPSAGTAAAPRASSLSRKQAKAAHNGRAAPELPRCCCVTTTSSDRPAPGRTRPRQPHLWRPQTAVTPKSYPNKTHAR